MPVNALLGSINVLTQVVLEFNPRAVVICFGAEAATYRVEAFEQYHADREATPSPLDEQWEIAPELFESFGWYGEDTVEFEADDLLHSLALKETKAGGQTLILTGDRDLFAAVNEHVTVLLQTTGTRGPVKVDRAEVIARYGIEPKQVTDFIALRGDPSDSIPGARGIGPKTAADLLRRYGTLEKTIANAIRERPAVRHSLIEQNEQLLMFKEIARLQTIPVKRPRNRETDWISGATAAEELGMRQLAGRLKGLSKQPRSSAI